MHAIRLSIVEANSIERAAGRSAWYRWRGGASLGVSWPSAIELAPEAVTSPGVARIEGHGQVLAGLEASFAARVPGTPLWLGFYFYRGGAFGTPAMEMVTTPSSSYRFGYAGFSPTTVGMSLLFRR